MIYLIWYVGIGVVIVLIAFISHKLSAKTEPDFAVVLESINPDRHTWHYKLLNNFVFPLIVAVTMPFAWPILIYMKAKEIASQRSGTIEPEEKVFAVTRAHLVRRTSIEEAEKQETVVDPLEAVPDLPFGFLNRQWEHFKAHILPGDQLWSFSARWEQPRFVETRQGYAILRANAVPKYFIAGWDTFELPPDLPEPDPTFEELEHKLTSWDWETRWSAIYGRKWKLTPKQIDRAQRDWKRMVRFAIAKRFDLDLTTSQIERGLIDKDESVREIYAYRNDYTLTPEQVERGLTDRSGMHRLRIAGRKDVQGRLSAAQIERGLADEDYCVRWHFADLAEYTPSETQIERGLTDRSDDVRLTFAKRKDATFTQEQIERGLFDESETVRALFSNLKALANRSFLAADVDKI